MQNQQQPKGYASVWPRNGGKIKASGSISVTPEVLISWADMPVDEYGRITLDLVLFSNDRATSDRHPQLTGYLQVPRPRQQSLSHSASMRAPEHPEQLDRPIEDYDEIPF